MTSIRLLRTNELGSIPGVRHRLRFSSYRNVIGIVALSLYGWSKFAFSVLRLPRKLQADRWTYSMDQN